MKNCYIILFLIACLGASTATAQNYNNCIRTNGSHGHVAISGLSLGASDFTVEMWIKIDTASYNGTGPGPLFHDPAVFCNKDWTSGANTGMAIAIYTGGVYKVNFTPSGISRFDQVSSGPFLEDRWNHIAVSVQRSGYVRMYTNGILTDSFNISSGAGHTIDGSYPYNLMDDGTGSYTWASFQGYVDEFRVWQSARTTDQIRQYMSRTLPSGTPGLLAYYRMDQNSGTTVTDLSGAGHNGTLTNLTSSAWVTSGAAVGDTSAYLYTGTFTGDSVTVTSPVNGTFSANNIASGMQGIQVYRTYYPPAVSAGLLYPGPDSLYFGVYPVSETAAYEVKYNYNGFPAAVTNQAMIQLYEQPNSLTAWSVITTANTIATRALQSVVATNYQHFVMGNMMIPTAANHPAAQPNDINIFPNPVTGGVLNIESAGGEKIEMNLFNLQGITVMSASIDKWPFSLDVSSLPAGSYFVHCLNDSRDESFKITIAK